MYNNIGCSCRKSFFRNLSIKSTLWRHILQKRHIINKTHNNADFEELADYFHGRKNKERKDSVTKLILLERKNHQDRFQDVKIDLSLIKYIEKIGLGSRKRKNNALDRHSAIKKTEVGAGGFAIHLTSASENWPLFTHILPEVAFAGHTNSGKSTLVNTVSGLAARKGPAKVSERAGWTDQICFFQLGKRPPVLVLADMPGYGHAVATANELSQWNKMIRDYLSNRLILSLCCVLVDCTRGLCIQDKQLITFLVKKNIAWRIVLTKCDLMTLREVAQSMEVISTDLIELLVTKPSMATKGTDSNKVPDDDENDVSASKSKNENASTTEGDVEDTIKPLVAEDTNDVELNIPSITYAGGNSNEFAIDDDRDSNSSSFFPVYENEDDVEWRSSTVNENSRGGEDDEKYVASDSPSDSEFNDEDDAYDEDGDDDDDDDDDSLSTTSAEKAILKSSYGNKQQSLDMMGIMRGHIIPVSSSTGAGIKQLWQNLTAMARLSTTPPAWDSISSSTSSTSNDKTSVAARYLKQIQELNHLKSLSSEISSGGGDGSENGHVDVSVKEHYKAYELKRMRQISGGGGVVIATSSSSSRRRRSSFSRQQQQSSSKVKVRSYTKEYNFTPK